MIGELRVMTLNRPFTIVCHLPLLLGAGALGLVGQAEGHVPLVVLVELHEDDDEADELDRVEDEAHGERDLVQGYKVLN